jgi:hypothetical protein
VFEDHLFAENVVKGATVTKERRGTQTVTYKFHFVNLELLHVVAPTDLLASEASDKFRGQIEFFGKLV